MEQAKAEDLVRRIATAVRGADLYSPTHPLVQRGIDNLVASTQEALQRSASIIVGFIDDEIVVDGDAAAARHGGARRLRARPARARDREDHDHARHHAARRSGAFVAVLGDRKTQVPLPDQLAARGVRHITLGRVVVEDVTDEQAGIAAAKRVYATAVADGGNAVGVGEGGRAARPRRPRARSSTASRGW